MRIETSFLCWRILLYMRLARRFLALGFAVLAVSPLLAGFVGNSIGSGILHPMKLNLMRLEATEKMLARTGAQKEDFVVQAQDGVSLEGWKVRPRAPNGDWVLVYHGVSDNRTGVLGHAEFLLRNGYSVVMMDSREHGESGGEMCTYGWLERHDSVAITNALFASEKVRHLYALGVSMGAAIALQSAAIEPRIEAVAAEAPFADLREVSYDYAGLDVSPTLGRTLFRPASILALNSVRKEGGFEPSDVSPQKAVAARPFVVLLICGSFDHRIPCRHAEKIYESAVGPRELWIVKGAGHAAALGHSPAEYERRVVQLFETYPKSP
jgi:hypothetical protein